MPQLEVSEGNDGRHVKTIQDAGGIDIPLNALSLDDGDGTVGQVHRTANAIHAFLAGQSGDIDVNLNADSLAGALDVALQNTPIDVSAAEVSVDVSSQSVGPLSVNLAQDNLSGTIDVAGQVAGDVAHGDADSGNPVKVAAVHKTSSPSAVDDGDRVELRGSDLGDLSIVPLSASDDQVAAVQSVDQVLYGGSVQVVQQDTIDTSTSSVPEMIVNAPSSGSIVVLSYEVTTTAAHRVALEDGDGNELDATYAGSNSGAVKDPTGPVGVCAPATALNVNLGGANDTYVRVSYIVA